MPIDIKNKLSRLNLDDNYYYLGKDDYVNALNITMDAQEQSEDVSVTNVTGNRLVPYNKPAGVNKVIGAKADVLRNRVFEFIWNSLSYHSIVIYDNTTRVRTKLVENITDTNGVDVLQFTLLNKINHCDIIYRGEDEGDLLFWTDGNVSPRKLNVKHIQDGDYTYIKVPFIELAKQPPRTPITAIYGSDSTRNSNSLRKKLIMATYRFSCDDFEKTTFTTYSKIALPIGYYGSDNDIDNTKNNYITFTVETGDENVTDIEIAVRFSIGNAWEDFILAVSLNKAQLGIPNNVTYDYLFYNDAIYPPLSVEETTQLFDWVPKKALSQVAGNGNTIELAAITEGYDNYPVGDLDVTITSENVENIPPDTDPPSLTYIFSGVNTWEFTVGGSVPVGTRYRIIAIVPGMGSQLFADYTSTGGDTVNDVSDALHAYILAHFAGYAAGQTPPSFLVIPPSPGFSVLTILVDVGTGGGSTISTEKTWLWGSNYIFGLAYKDDQGRIMPGVTTFVNPIDSNNDFLVTTDPFSLNGVNPETPVITANINHLPPAGAVTFAWVRRRMTFANFLYYETCDYQDPSDGYLYFCLANIESFKLSYSQFIYSSAPVTPDSRIKIIAGITLGAYDGDIYTQDYEILGQEERTLTGGSSPADDRLFIKVKKPTGSISPSYKVNMLVMVYTPMSNPTDIADSVYYEWGEEYAIYTGVGGINYHRGLDQDQTASQPAIFTWAEGDVYFHTRTMFPLIVTSPTGTDTVNIMDANWSDFFASSVNDNGRGISIEPNAKETFFPATIRFSREYQQNTNINETNRFLYLNFIDLDRSYGSILKMAVRDRVIRIGQQFKIGVVPMFSQINVDADGNSLRADSDTLLNPVRYFAGDYGVGNAPGCWVDFNFSSYFFDTNRGIWCRCSTDGITPISQLYKINSWATTHGVLRGYDFKIYGTFDPKSNNCIFSFEATEDDPAYTLTFNEQKNAYESFMSYHPEFMCALGSLLITYKDGDTWTHDGDKYNNFYGVQYPSFINPIFNDQPSVKKVFNAISYRSNEKFISPEIGDINTSMINPQTEMRQESRLKDFDYDIQENVRYAAFKKDANSRKDWRQGLANGEYLNGDWISVKLVCPVDKSSSLVFLNKPYVKWQVSPRNF